MAEWNLSQLFFADTVLVADSEGKLRQLVEEFGKVNKRRTLRVNESKSKVMKCTTMVDDRLMNTVLNWKVASEGRVL